MVEGAVGIVVVGGWGGVGGRGLPCSAARMGFVGGSGADGALAVGLRRYTAAAAAAADRSGRAESSLRPPAARHRELRFGARGPPLPLRGKGGHGWGHGRGRGRGAGCGWSGHALR